MSSDEKISVPSHYTDPDFVHRFLLTENPETLLQVPVSSLSYEDFMVELESDSDISYGMKRAWRDGILERLHNSSNVTSLKPIQDLLVELHNGIRGLIPNRQDLFHLLSDNAAKEALTSIELKTRVVYAAKALSQLESESRSVTTDTWIQDCSDRIDLEPKDIINSLLYLLYKTELCQADKEQFFFKTRWAPWLQTHGKELETNHFQSQYGPLGNPETAPFTRQWIHDLLERMQVQPIDLTTNRESRRNFIRAGWIDTIVFRDLSQENLHLPEIFVKDADTVYRIRDATRLAAAGSALALHTCNATGTPTSVLSKLPDELSLNIADQRAALLEAMSQKVVAVDIYEERVAKAVISLAKSWDPSLSSETEVMLESQTRNVLATTDPVIRLLLGRMKTVFHQLAVSRNTTPVTWRTGTSSSTPRDASTNDAYVSLFADKGLAFFGSLLSEAALLALRVVDLAYDLYEECLIDGIIRDFLARDT